MKSPAIPEIIDPSKSCDKKLIYQGAVASKHLPRFLAAQSAELNAEHGVEVMYSFRRDEQLLRIADLRFETTAKLTCQRCLDLLELRCEGELTFVFCRDNKEAEQAPKGYEPVLVRANTVNLWQLLEDELLLCLPMFANHRDEQCNSDLNGLRREMSEQVAVSPFAVLDELLKK